jgi:hypothetical protein
VSIPVEVDDLERLVAGLVQDIGRKKASLKTLDEKIATAKQHLERCRYFKTVCGGSLKEMKTSKDVVSLDDYRRMKKLYEDNYDLILKYQAEIINRSLERQKNEEAIPGLESSLRDARGKLAQWGVVVPWTKK